LSLIAAASHAMSWGGRLLTSLFDEEVKMRSSGTYAAHTEISARRCATTRKQLLSRRPPAKSATFIAKILVCAALFAACGQQAIAQVVVPGINAPPLVHFPSAPIQVPSIPQAGVTPQPNLAPLPQNTFSDRVSTCLQTGAASGLTGATLNAYTGQCANQ
jgi:hypothetical protein